MLFCWFCKQASKQASKQATSSLIPASQPASNADVHWLTMAWAFGANGYDAAAAAYIRSSGSNMKVTT
jgi:hypothetical protein